MHLKETFQNVLKQNPDLNVINLYTIKKPNEQRQCHLKAEMKIPYTNAIKTIDLINADARYQVGINLNQFMDNVQIDFNQFDWNQFIDNQTYKDWVYLTQDDRTQWLSINRQYDPLNFANDVKRAFQLISTIHSALNLMMQN